RQKGSTHLSCKKKKKMCMKTHTKKGLNNIYTSYATRKRNIPPHHVSLFSSRDMRHMDEHFRRIRRQSALALLQPYIPTLTYGAPATGACLHGFQKNNTTHQEIKKSGFHPHPTCLSPRRQPDTHQTRWPTTWPFHNTAER
ncbi:unnamed protein product, partial [Ectocarpus sp. 12 AP-2014]